MLDSRCAIFRRVGEKPKKTIESLRAFATQRIKKSSVKMNDFVALDFFICLCVRTKYAVFCLLSALVKHVHLVLVLIPQFVVTRCSMFPQQITIIFCYFFLGKKGLTPLPSPRLIGGKRTQGLTFLCSECGFLFTTEHLFG